MALNTPARSRLSQARPNNLVNRLSLGLRDPLGPQVPVGSPSLLNEGISPWLRFNIQSTEIYRKGRTIYVHKRTSVNDMLQESVRKLETNVGIKIKIIVINWYIAYHTPTGSKIVTRVRSFNPHYNSMRLVL